MTDSRDTGADSVADMAGNGDRDVIVHATTYATTGTGLGSVAFLALQAIDPGSIPVTRTSVLTLFLVAALIGELTWLFSLDRWPFPAQLALHCLGALGLSTCWLATNGWTDMLGNARGLWFLLTFAGIYAAVWALVGIDARINAHRMNLRLAGLRRQRGADGDEGRHGPDGPAAPAVSDVPTTPVPQRQDPEPTGT
ncbi:DUF3021 domain-containing protein [uncultured Bifidobacterium sp.]|uniref:DUF3021 domain-containing protein n=1 Tax=uncultured Bifidobacterium sp. TaxID=165187 RepID=UPI0028DC8A89|nr:DUF3021 domain-containing protein [uncultured Bifidobacterium sp.]